VNEELLEQIEEITTDGELAKQVLEAAKVSMGQDISDLDLVPTPSIIVVDLARPVHQGDQPIHVQDADSGVLEGEDVCCGSQFDHAHWRECNRFHNKC
jgi:hypothetical protein